MSEDLRYYFFDHYAEEHPSIPADEGWKQMQQLLDKELPVSAKRKPFRYMFFVSATLIGVILLMMSLPLPTYFKQKTIVESVKKETGSKREDHSIEAENQMLSYNHLQNESLNIYQQNTNLNTIVRNSNLLPALKNSNIVSLPIQTTQSTQVLVENNYLVNIAPEVASVAVADSTANDATKDLYYLTNEIDLREKNKKTIPDLKKWQLNAGVAVNISLSNTLHALRPYPFAEIKYELTPRLFAGASFALFSPVGSHASGIKKTVYVNDTSSNVSSYNETLNYTRLTFADIGLSGGIKLSKQISVQSGIQLSGLLNTKRYTTLEPYDFDMNRVNITGQEITTLPLTPSAAPVYNNRIEAQKFDIRYTAGINYSFKKISLGLQYQAGINPVLKGDAVTADKNKLIILKAAYRFK
jgi:hypothetical protein